MTRLLLERGADVNLVDRDGDTALVWAAMRGSQEVLSLILEVNKRRGRADGGNEVAPVIYPVVSVWVSYSGWREC